MALNPTSNGSRRTGRALAAFLALAGILTLAVTLIALSGRLHLILPPWHRALGAALDPALPPILSTLAVILLYLLGCRVLWRARAWLFVIWGVLGALAVRLAVLSLAGDPLALLFACATGNCSGGFTLGLETNGELLRAWPALMAGLRAPSPHLAISAPGWPFLYWKLAQGLERLPALSDALANVLRPLGCDWWEFNALTDSQVASSWLGVSAPLWSALAAVPLYLLGRIAADEETARGALLWWPLIPVLAFFAGSPSPTYALPATVTVALLWTGLSAPRPRASAALIALAGLLLGVTLVITFSVLPLLLLCGALILCHAIRLAPRDPVGVARRTVDSAIPFGLGLLVVYAGYLLLARHSLLTVFRTAIGLHLDSGGGLTYLGSLGLNAWDFVLFTGIPICALAVVFALRKHARGVTCLAAALGVTLAVLLLSGTARGEVARVWAYFAPFVVLAGAATWSRLNAPWRWLAVTAQIALLLAVGARFTPEGTHARPVPAYEDVAAPPLAAPETPVDARFGEDLRLAGYRYEARGGLLTLALRWEALRRNDLPYYFSAVLVGPDGRALPGIAWQPLATRYPTTCWAPGQPIVDRVDLPLGENPSSGDWWLSLSAFGMRDAQPLPNLPVTLPGGTADAQIGLGPLRVAAP